MTVSELLETYRGMIYPWHCDHMGHMNVMWYVGKFDEATWNLFAAAGVTTAFLKENRRGMAAVQQNITYRRELLVHEMRNAVTGEISAVCVLTGVQIDTQTRKSCPFPPELADRARSLVRPYELPG